MSWLSAARPPSCATTTTTTLRTQVCALPCWYGGLRWMQWQFMSPLHTCHAAAGWRCVSVACSHCALILQLTAKSKREYSEQGAAKSVLTRCTSCLPHPTAAGGRMIGKSVSNAVLDGWTGAFYQWEGEVKVRAWLPICVHAHRSHMLPGFPDLLLPEFAAPTCCKCCLCLARPACAALGALAVPGGAKR